MGMPLTIGHHSFSEDSDVEEVVILSDSEGEKRAKGEKKNINKERGTYLNMQYASLTAKR